MTRKSKVKRLTLREALLEANGLLRSAHHIAVRKGKDTNWGAFTTQVYAHLERVHRLCYPAPPFK